MNFNDVFSISTCPICNLSLNEADLIVPSNPIYKKYFCGNHNFPSIKSHVYTSFTYYNLNKSVNICTDTLWISFYDNYFTIYAKSLQSFNYNYLQNLSIKEAISKINKLTPFI